MDDSLRELERLAAQGDPGAIDRLELARRRAGLASTPVVLPPIGDSPVEVTLTEWCVGPGDWVKKDQVIAVLETDKICVELVAPDDGVLADLAYPPGQVAAVGATVARLTPSPLPDPALEARHDALLAEVAAAPEDAAPRLEYARFLVQTAALGKGVRPWGCETTRARGESILLHHARSGAISEEEMSWLRHRLSARVARTALDLLPFAVQGATVEGGFLTGVDGTGVWVCERWARLVESAPITSLGISDLAHAARVVALPRLEQVRALALGPRVSPRALDALAASGRLRVQRLTLRSVDPVASLAALGATELRLEHRPPPTWLAGSSVERLELDLDVGTDAAFRELVDAVPASVREIAARVRVAGTFLTFEQTQELVGPRHVPARR